MSGDGNRFKEKCPLLENPYADCYCTKMDSQSIAYMLEFCNKDWAQCEIYLRVIDNLQADDTITC